MPAVITMASTAGRAPSQAPLGYGVAKAGVIMLARQAAHDLGPSGVRVNCISPSAVLTDRTAQHMPPSVREADFDAILRRAITGGVAHASGPFARDGEVNRLNGGRGVYVWDKDGNSYEFFTTDPLG